MPNRAIISRLEAALLQSRLGPQLKAWRSAYQDRAFERAFRRRRQGAVVADVLYRALTGRPANRHEQATMRQRALNGTELIELADELRNTPEGWMITSRTRRAYMRAVFDSTAAEPVHPRVVFLHMQKAGGTSLSAMLVNWFGRDRAMVGMWVDDLLFCPPQLLARLNVIAGHLPYAALPLIPPPFDTVTVLRDPFSRTLSHFDNLRRVYPAFRGLSLEQFVFDETFQVAGNLQARYLAHDVDLANAWRSWSPEHRLAYLWGDSTSAELPVTALFELGPTGCSDEELLRKARRNLEQIDLVGTTDALHDLGVRLADRLGFPESQLPQHNATPGRPDIEDVSSIIRRQIEKRTAVDRELYDLARQRAR
ncbi:MAG: hypothetical protein J2P57_12240 [Acidimicrobiaceae bacterium]|nr:hypothetical protein [Acidimicrobiaceae bacterium]